MDEEAWVSIIHGEGRAFCAGADIKQRFVEMTPRQSALRSRGTSAEGYLARTINWKPVIAAVHGYCLGAGLSLAGECDLIVASEEASSVSPRPAAACPGPGLGQVQRLYALQDTVGNGDNRRAHSGGGAIPPGPHQPPGPHRPAPGRGKGTGRKGAAGPALASRSGVRLTRRQWVMDLYDAGMYLQPLQLHKTEDFQESARAFVEKRKPEYGAR